MNEKPKNEVSRPSVWMFLILWCAGHFAGWYAGGWVCWDSGITWELARLLSSNAPGSAVYLIAMALIIVPSQWFILRWMHISVRFWTVISLAGWIIGGTGMSMHEALLLQTNFYSRHNFFLIGFVPVSILQWWLLRQRFRAAYLWILASAVSSLVFEQVLLLPVWVYSHYLLQFAIAGISAGIVTGITLLWLIQHPRKEQKPEPVRF